MKKFNFNPNVLTAGVALALGVVATGVAVASTTTGAAPSAGSVSITNTATALYSVDGVAQPQVTSNAVVVNISESGSFTLVATQGASSTDDKNENQALSAPAGSVSFTNKLTNTGNVTDTYTINLSDDAAGIITGVTDKFGYTNETSTSIAVVIKNADGSTVSTTAITSGGTITLLPGQYAELTYSLTADGAGVGGDSGLATITATSSYITNLDSTKATLTNENQAILKLPVFAIVKTAANASVDLNSATTIDYTIKVTNDGTAAYAADATNILIQDAIPAGLTLVPTSVSLTGTADTTYTNNSTASLLKINDLDLKVGETAIITFKVNIADKAALAKAGSVTNHADVYDNYDNTTPDPANPQIYDSTSSSDPTKAKVPNDPTGTGTGGDSAQTVTFTDRALTLTGGATAELPTTSSPVAPAKYTQVITNNGNTAESGLTFTITNPSSTDNITPIKVVYTAPDGTQTTLTPVNGVYTIPGSIGAGQTGTITYDVATTGATPNTQETNTVTLIPAAVNGTTTPSVPAVTNTTEVKDMSLLKEQALDATCDGTPDAAFSTAQVTATPTQCVIYKITATNNFTTKRLTNVVISDAASQWSAKATYVPNSITQTPAGTPVAPGAEAKSSALIISASGTGTLQFSIKINQ